MSQDFEDLVRRARDLVSASGRAILGICGAPGSGKTTFAEALVSALARPEHLGPDGVSHVPMDGFHLADVELRRLGRLDHKGAAETFDAAGYTALLSRLRGESDEIVYAPAFERDLEQPLAGAIAVGSSVRLVARHMRFGKSAAEAEAWVARVDEANAREIAETAGSADLLIAPDVIDEAPRSAEK